MHQVGSPGEKAQAEGGGGNSSRVLMASEGFHSEVQLPVCKDEQHGLASGRWWSSPESGRKIFPHLKLHSLGMAHRDPPEGRRHFLGNRMLASDPVVASGALWKDLYEAGPREG